MEDILDVLNKEQADIDEQVKALLAKKAGIARAAELYAEKATPVPAAPVAPATVPQAAPVSVELIPRYRQRLTAKKCRSGLRKALIVALTTGMASTKDLANYLGWSESEVSRAMAGCVHDNLVAEKDGYWTLTTAGIQYGAYFKAHPEKKVFGRGERNGSH